MIFVWVECKIPRFSIGIDGSILFSKLGEDLYRHVDVRAMSAPLDPVLDESAKLVRLNTRHVG